MKKIHLAAALLALTGFAGHAMAATCAEQATEKKLAGAAKSSFMKKCEREAMQANPAFAGCDKAAGEKKLAGAARSSFMKKCVADGGPSAAAAPASAPAK